MEQVALLESGSANKTINVDYQLNNQDKNGNLMIQELNILSFNQILDTLTNDNQNKEIDENQMIDDLSDNEQLMVYYMLNNLEYLTKVYQSANQELNTEDNSQQFYQKLFTVFDENNSEIKLILKNLIDLSKENLILNDDKSNKNSNYITDTKTINLQSNLFLNSLPNYNKNSYSNYTDQDFEVKMLDLNQLQMNYNNVSNEVKVDNKLLDNNQELQNLFVNKDFTNEFGKIIIKNLKLPNGDSETKIQLQPKELGQVNVKLSTHNGQITAQITAETIMGKELLESQIHQLKNSLTMLGFQVERIDVQQITSTSTNLNNFSSNQHNNNFEFSEQQFSQQQKHEQDSTNYLNSKIISEEEIINDMYYESGIDYKV